MDNNGLIDWEETWKDKYQYCDFYQNLTVRNSLLEHTKSLLSEQKLKTTEDTLNSIEAIWTRLMNETDDPAKKEVYANCVKALKI